MIFRVEDGNNTRRFLTPFTMGPLQFRNTQRGNAWLRLNQKWLEVEHAAGRYGYVRQHHP